MADIAGSNVGFMLSFVDNATPALNQVTRSYETMSRAMDYAMKKATSSSNVGRFDRAMQRMANGLSDVAKQGGAATGSISGFGATSSGSNTVNVNITGKIPALAKGGIVNKPTIAMIGEAGPEAVVPLSKGGGGGIGGGGGDPKFMANASMAFDKFRVIRKEWSESFGKKSQQVWKSVNDQGGKFFKGMKDALKGGAIAEFAGNLESIKESTSQLGGDLTGIADDVNASFNDATKSIQQQLQLSRSELVEFRAQIARDFGDSAVNITELTNSLADLASKGFDPLDSSTQQLAANLSSIQELTGTDLADSVEGLSFKMGMGADAVNKFTLDMTQAVKVARQGGMQITMDGIAESMVGTADAIGQMTKGWTDLEKANAARATASMAAGLQSVGMQGSDATAVLETLFTGGKDAQIALAKIGVSGKQMADAMKSGDLSILFDKMSVLGKTDPGSLNVFAEKISEMSGVDMKFLLEMGQNADAASASMSEFNKAMVESDMTNAKLQEQLTNSRSTFENLANSAKNFLQQNEAFRTFSDILDDVNPAQLLATVQIGQGAVSMASSIWSVVSSLFAKTAATTADTAATAANTTAQSANIFTMIKGVAVKALDIAKTILMATWQGIVTAATWAWQAAQWALNIAMSANPIGLVIAGVVALVGAIIWAYNEFETVRNVVNALWEGMKVWLDIVLWPMKTVFGLIADGVNWVIDAFGGMGSILAWVKEYWLLFLGPIGWAIEAFKFIWNLLSTAPEGGFLSWIKKGLDAVLSPIEWIWNKIKSMVDWFGDDNTGAEGASAVSDVIAGKRSADSLQVGVGGPNASPALASGLPEMPGKTTMGAATSSGSGDDISKKLDTMISILREIQKGGMGSKKASGPVRPVSANQMALKGTA